ncbi:MAG: DUF4838 domain-containing protein [Treponema sp.]|jgi:hypothetical protein|nr:DUF4838 domain-containing protein [Treponema sp.]
MFVFDVSREWVILSSAAARTGADEIAQYLYRLRSRAGLSMGPPPVEDAAGPAPADPVPLIVLNGGETGGGRIRNGFSWRLGTDRLEIYGDSDRGLLNGVFDFLDALGIRWPAPDREELPPPPAKKTPQAAGNYPLARDKAYSPSAASPRELRRLFAGGKKKTKNRGELFRWAARNKIDVAVLSLKDRSLRIPAGSGAAAKKSPLKTAEQYALILEAGGWDLSLLVPRRLFPFRRELFRMESGKRTPRFNFCPTNPETIALLKKEARRIFRAVLDGFPEIQIWHLWPDRGHEKTWCSCPACRAFSAEDQNRIAVNAVADVLAELAPRARLSLPEPAAEQEPGDGISLRPNIFCLKGLPPEA